ncbi:MAG: hypothetical protein WC322_02230 [Candidatus Paceibacterota bacterium]|jgi:hypothetical protein
MKNKLIDLNNHPFILCDRQPIEDYFAVPDEYFLVELDCDHGRARTPQSIWKKKFMYYCEKTRELFGDSPNDVIIPEREVYRDGRYRHYWRLKRVGTEEIYTIYCCYYVWRIGGNDQCAHLGELMELLNPEMYAGYSLKSREEIVNQWREQTLSGLQKAEA